MDIEPSLGAFVIRTKASNQPPEPGGMVHLNEMRHFVRREVIEDETGRQDEPPRI